MKQRIKIYKNELKTITFKTQIRISRVCSYVFLNYEILSTINPIGKDEAQNIWSIFEKYLLKYPEQWEMWLYIDEFICRNNLCSETYNNNKDFRYNNKRYEFLKQEGLHYLFDNHKMVKVKISETLFNTFIKMEENDIYIPKTRIKDIIKNDSLRTQLTNMRILI